MSALESSPTYRKLYGKAVGEILVKEHGKKEYYTPAQVKSASSRTKYNVDWHCWAMCLYCSAPDFVAFHESIGEACDYASMRAKMTSAMTDGKSDSWFDVDLSWLEWPDVDLSSIFDIFD